MAADTEWLQRNLGIGGLTAGAVDQVHQPESDTSDRALARRLIDFDSEGPTGKAFQAVALQGAVGLSHYVPIEWPANMAPQPATAAPSGESLPKADVLIVTWTADEGHALSQVMTPGFDSHTAWKPYTKNFATIANSMVSDCPARQAGRLGTYWTTKVDGKKITLFKSDSHMSQDGPDLANATVWKQIIQDCQPTWVLTTGTGGGIGPECEVGDVVVSRFVTFDCQRTFAKLNGLSYACPTSVPTTEFPTARKLFGPNANLLPKDNTRPPKIIVAARADDGILTTDFFGFDNTDDTYGLKGKGDLSEMGDAVLGMVCDELGADAPLYAMVRNVSDPQIASTGLSLEQQKQLAAHIYQGYGLWSTICSAIVCWSIVAAL
jgi:hypothetical protein